MPAPQVKQPFAPFTTEWGSFAPLRLRAKVVAEGLYAGQHRSVRKGSGVEFFGQRPYVSGDDLRFVDKRSLLRHGRLMIREFETETDRALWLVVDATASMAFVGRGPGSKFPFAALLAASVARVAISAGDPVGLVVLGGDSARALPARAGRESFERIVWTLSATRAQGDWSSEADDFSRALEPVHERARRGSNIVLFSDLVDLPPGAQQAFGALATRGRRAFAVRVLSPEEVELPFREQARFASLEGNLLVDADPAAVRRGYQARLSAQAASWSEDLIGRGGALVDACTTDSAVEVIRALLLAVRGAHA